MTATVEARWGSAELDALALETGVAVLRDPSSLRAASGDFGGLVRGNAAGLALPRDAAEVTAIVAFAQREGLRVTPRGRGLSQSGQSVPPDGALSLDLRRLDRVGEVEAPPGESPRIACGAGARFRDVVIRASRRGLLPRVAPLNLDLTVGGVVSVGGVGATTHAHGPIVSRVPELVAVTGLGETVTATRTERREVLDAALAGLGRAVIICQVALELRPFAPRVTTFQLLYDDAGRFLHDQRSLAFAPERAPEYLEAFVVASPHSPGVRFFALHASYEHERGAPPTDEQVLRDVAPYRRSRGPELDTLAFASRYEPRFEAMVRTGAWELAHPWVEAFLPAESLGELLPRVLAELPPFLGDGHRILLFRNHDLPPFLAVPSGAAELAAFAILPVGVPAGVQDDARLALLRADRILREAGGKRYLSGWLGPMDEDAWKAHHGPRHHAWLEAKRTLDPRGIFTSSLFT